MDQYFISNVVDISGFDAVDLALTVRKEEIFLCQLYPISFRFWKICFLLFGNECLRLFFLFVFVCAAYYERGGLVAIRRHDIRQVL